MKTFTLMMGLLFPATATFAATPSGSNSPTRTDAVAYADPSSVCIEAENSFGTAPVSDDPNASNGKTRGVRTEWDHYVDYEVNGAAAGTYDLTIRYYAEGDAAVYVSVNNNVAISQLDLPATHSWNIVWAERTIQVNLAAGYNKIRVGGKQYYRAVRQDKICLTRTGGPVACDYNIRPYSLDTWPIYTPGQTMNFTANCTGADCGTTTFKWNGNGIDLTGQTVTLPAPTVTGDYQYTVVASREGCADTTATLPIRVQTTPAKCDYVAGPMVNDYTPACGEGMAVSVDCFGTGCPGLNYKWSGPGVDVSGTSSVNFNAPSQNGTFTYTLTSSKDGCPDVVGEFKLIITSCGDGPYQLCLEAEDAGGTGPVTEDPNASGGKTRGGRDRSDYTMYYLIYDVQKAGPHSVTLRYYAEANTAVDLTVNGDAPRRMELPASHSWNIVWTEQTVVVNLKTGLNTIYIQGLNGYSPVRHDKICVEELPGTGDPACDFSLDPGPSTPTPTCSGQFSLNTACTGPDCDGVNYHWTGNGVDAWTKDAVVNTPGTNGTYTYSLTATKDGCTARNFSYDVTVFNCPPYGEPFIACIEAEQSGGSGPISSDPNASNGQTRGAQNDYNHYVDYRADGVAQSGIYPVTIRYYAAGDAQVKIAVNDIVVIPALQLPATHSWNVVAREETFYINLAQGNNTIQISGLPGPSVRQDKICIGNRQNNARMAAPEPVRTVSDSPLLQAYPNPAPGEFKAVFHLESGEAATIRVTDVQGKVWHIRSVQGKGTHEERIRLGNAPDGIYLLQVKKPDSTEIKKILLAH